jgi:hypothetical protein
MAIEDNLDQLYALYVANNILCMRMWSYIASIGAKAEGFTEDAWVEKQRKMSLESVELWGLEGHRNPERFRAMVKEQLNRSWGGMIKGRSSDSPLQ